ncbi:type I secretion system permease/ATPase [Proteus mirabilis]|uniref:type I secretion system permease/ATPase n=2 Tax=Proteus mirabilis TaxID=584 RepID=UPI00028337B7|nr:type I secretion system permease/ATPase [Proteus mirabilis]EKB02138.1 type I secretion system ATPase [Proteus mirabilis WGLW6]EKU2371218.1 type I secretion system permease/ATPase [Proteus mirabilis]EKU7918743.1 type I secretion system permease/ATPase [Proteus mirabilis]EKU7922678.1 type I secretion system permease/ATPase [Proteus mirabilis]EKU8689851.1 type I secretion system permease/ATPase [Proteus mirabilis]
MPQIKYNNEITSIIKERRKVFLSIGLFTALINILMLVPSIYMLQVYDRVLPSGNEMTLLMLTIIMLALFIFMGGLEYLRSIIVIRMSNKLDLSLNSRIYTAAYREKLNKIANINPTLALTDLITLRQFITSHAIFTFFDLPWFPIYLLVITLFNPWLGLFALCGALILFALAILNEYLSKNHLKKANNFANQAQLIQSHHLEHPQTIEAMGMLSQLRKQWQTSHFKYLQAQTQASDNAAGINAITKVTRMALQSLMLGLGGWLAIDNTISPGMMIAGSILLGRALAPIEQVINVWKSWDSSKAAYNRLTTLLKTYPQENKKMALPKPQGQLLVNIDEAVYPHSDRILLNNINFALLPGDILGIIGPSASGKSSLAKFIVGIWQVKKGIVRLDNADIFQWSKEEIGPHIGYLPQEIALFPGTIAENIARFTEVDPQKVIQAAKMAHVHEMILRFPQGYETQIGAHGEGLSGGQKQRIALARALYSDPTLVVLDEPNSNLDDLGIRALTQAIETLKQHKKTVILITHQKQLLSVTNKLLVIFDGNTKLFGPTASVIAELNNPTITKTANTISSTPATSNNA